MPIEATPSAGASTQITWDQSDAQALRQFLLSNPKFLTVLRNRRDKSAKHAKTVEEAATAGQRSEGWIGAVEEVEAMAFPPDPQRSGVRPNIAV